jgi:hypothetical protein
MSSILLATKVTRAILAAAATEFAAKVRSLLPDATFMSNGEPMTTAQMATQADTFVTATQATNSGRASLHELVVAEDDALATFQGSVRSFLNYIIAQYGEPSTMFGALGFTAKKATHKTAASKALAVEKSLATRAERHTLGKRQKESIHGTVPTPAPTTPDKPGPTKA